MLRRIDARLAVATWALLASTALVAFAAPGATAAEPAPKGLEGSFALQGTHGFRLFGLVASTGKTGVLILTVSKKGEAATYFAHGEVTTERVDFDLGALGSIDLGVQPNGGTETIDSGCGVGGKSTTIPAQDYVGTIEFHGEEGFTEATTARTHLLLASTLRKLVCDTSGSGEDFGSGTRGLRIRVGKKQGPKLQLNQNRQGAGVLYSAEISEREGAVKVERSVSGRLGGDSLSFDPSLGHASFRGGGPFSGSATYSSTSPPRGTHPGHGSWRGNLEVDFPGRSGVRVAGAGFPAAIIHAERTR